MHHHWKWIPQAAFIALLAAMPQVAHADDIDPNFCRRLTITEPAAQMVRDWGERYDISTLIADITKPGWTADGTIEQASGSQIICRISFSNLTATMPARRLDLRDIDFRYSLSTGSLDAVTLPMSGFDKITGLKTIWERLFVDGATFRAVMEKKAESDPEVAEVIGGILKWGEKSEPAKWDAASLCQRLDGTAVSAAIVHWAEATNQVRATGITAKETPSWLPATGWSISNIKVLSSIPYRNAICSADVAYTANPYSGGQTPMAIMGMSYKILANDDGSTGSVDVNDWPTEYQQRKGDDAFNRAWVVNGQTFAQAVAEKRKQDQGKPAPKSPLEILMQQQQSYNKQLEAYARERGMPIDQIGATETAETRKYAESCRKSGGTWGWPTDKFGNKGRLGCYHPTGAR